MSLIFILLTAASFFQDFPALRSQDRWTEITATGEEALNEASKEEAMKIHGILASSYFYAGDYETAGSHASHCYELACELADPDQEVHGLYLLSAIARAEGDFSAAKSIAEEALEKSQGEIRAKVLFNLGAAHADDPKGDLAAAEKHLREALTHFTHMDDQHRTILRLGKIYLLLGKVEKAQELLQQAKPEIKTSRIQMHAVYLEAQIEKALGHSDLARKLIEEALAKAEKLGAAQDAKRYREFYESL